MSTSPRLLRVDASFRTDGSVTREGADSAVAAWQGDTPEGTVVHRELAQTPLPAEAWGLAVSAAFSPEETWNAEQRAAQAVVAELADEIIGADVLVLASPLYNFGVDQHTKTWIDLIIADPRLGPGTTALNGKQVLTITAQGGRYTAGAPCEGWDHNTPYLQRVFADYFGMDVTVVTADLTLAEVNPAMASMVDASRESLSQAHEQATGHGSRLAAGVTVA